MTITASATDRDLVGAVDGASYGTPAADGPGSYTVRPSPAFDLDVERNGETWSVLDRETGIHGAGDTPTEALADFRRAAVEHLDVLERQDSLSNDLLAQLAYLRERVRPAVA